MREAAGLISGVRVNDAIDDADLLELAAELEQVGRLIDARRTSAAAQIARRSARSLGHAGLAARLGHRTPSSLISSLTRVTGRQADHRSRVGALVAPLESLADAVSAGSVSTDAAESIAIALGPVAGRVPAPLLVAEVTHLVDLAAVRPADEVAVAAKNVRDRLDRDHIETRERDLRAQRYLRFGRETDGLIPVRGLLPPEEAGVVVALFDARTSVRRTVAFGDSPGTSASSSGLDHAAYDDRTMDQRRADTFVEICRIAAGALAVDVAAPPLGNGAGTVVVTIAQADLEAGIGAARVDGVAEPISAASARRIACNAGLLPFVLGGQSQPLDLGYSRRLFSAGQRRALGERDRGCAVPGCDAPPGWTEAHHVTPWSRGGPTDLDNGVLLCSFHHHLVHEGRLIVEIDRGRPRVSRAVEAKPLAPPPARAARARSAARAQPVGHAETSNPARQMAATG